MHLERGLSVESGEKEVAGAHESHHTLRLDYTEVARRRGGEVARQGQRVMRALAHSSIMADLTQGTNQ